MTLDWLYGLGFSCVVGTVVITPLATYLHWALDQRHGEVTGKPQRFGGWSTAVGFLERLVITLFLFGGINAAAAFIGTWILAKMASGWNLTALMSASAKSTNTGAVAEPNPNLAETPRERFQREKAMLILFLNLISILFALVGYWIMKGCVRCP